MSNVSARLIVLGNGFDLAHGLHTKYSDFLKTVKCENSSFYEAVCQYIPEDALWSNFEEALAYLDDEQLRDDNSCYLLGYGDKNWKDSAHHDFQYMIGEFLSFAKYIPEYFLEWIKAVNTSVHKIMPLNIFDDNSIYLNFNYTDILEKVYGISESRILYIHGKASRNDVLVVGHHDEGLIQEDEEPVFKTEEEKELYYENYDEDVRITEANAIIKDYFINTFKNTDEIIEKHSGFFEKLTVVREIYIFGHSLSDIDYSYFLEIKNKTGDNSLWKISYHDDEDYLNANKFVKMLNISNYELFYF